MTYQQIAAEIQRLTLEEQLLLLEMLSKNVRKSIKKQKKTRQTHEKYAASQMMGILRPDHGVIPTDEEMKEDYIHYLTDKYLS